MQLSTTHLTHEISQTALTFGERVIDSVLQNKILIAALLALGCLAAYLYKLINHQLAAQLAAKTTEPIETDRSEEKTPAAKTQNVFLQAISQDENHREAEPVAEQEDQEGNKEPLPILPSPRPSPLEKEAEILDEKKKKVISPVSDPTPDPIDPDPVELQRKLKEQQDNRRKLISDGVKQKLQYVDSLEQYIETTDDLIYLLNERTSFASAEAIRRNDPHYLDSDRFLNPLFVGHPDALSRRLEKKFNISLVEFAVRHVKDRMSRMYLAHAFHQSYVFLLGTSLTKNEIIDFLNDIEGTDLHEKYGPSFSNLRRYSCRLSTSILDSIFPGIGGGGPHAANFKEMQAKGIAIFKEFFADDVVKSDSKFEELFVRCLKDHNPEHLQALFEMGYQDPVLSVKTEELEELEQQDKEYLIKQKGERQRKLLEYLKDRRNANYNDYDRLKETINRLIKNKFLEPETFGVQSSHDLVIQEFVPDHFVVLHMLESPHCDLQTLMLLARKVPCDFKWEFQQLMDRALIAIANPMQCEGSPRACQFLSDHYFELEEDVKKALAWALKEPKIQIVKQMFFNNLGI